MTTIQDFISANGITMTAERVPQNPNGIGDGDWNRTAAHHFVTLSCEGREMRVYFSQGSAAFDNARTFGHRKMKPIRFMSAPQCDGCFRAWPCPEILTSKDKNAQPAQPKIETVLDCLADDASGYENTRDFEDWCAEYGYDTDSRKAERTYHVEADQAKALRHLLGTALYDALTSGDVERL